MASADSPSGSPPSPPSSSGAASSPDSPPTQDSPPPPTSKSSPPPPSDSSNSPPPPSDSSHSPPPANSPPPPKSPASPPPPSKSPPSPPSPPPDSSSPPPPPDSSEAPSPTPSDDSPAAPPPPPPPPSPPSPPGVPNPPAALSPPPPPHHKTPSKTPSSSGSSNSNSSSSSGLSTTAIAGIAVAGAVAAVVLIALLYCCCCRRKRKRQHHYEEGPYYGGPPPAPHKDDYYAQYAHHNPLSEVNNYVKNPPPGPPPNNSGGSQLERLPSSTSFPGSLPPPPPPPPFSSGEDSSNFTGRRPPSPSLGIGPSRTTFTYEQLAQATNGFSQTNLLGQGGFGYVYKGVLTGGQLIAVKQLKSGGGQGEREFQAEVEIISRVHHRHLVSLIGYCIAGKQRILVYEFVANDTLEHHLHSKDEPTMDWSTRVKIAIGAARGLTYLHEDCYPKIIHRDIKSSNILLDSHYEAKVADFGLAKIASEGFTHVSTRVMGTFGYLAPEYASSGKLTDKSDVFSFGVVLLELITGRRPVDVNQSYAEDSLVDWARPLLIRAMEEVNPGPLVDPRLGNEYNQSEMMRMIGCAAVAIRHSARRRPRMGQIVRIMEGDVTLDDLNDGLRAGQSTIYSSLGDSDYDASQYNDDLKKHMKLAYGTRGYTSEFSGPASEYGTNASESSTEYHHSKEVDITGGNVNIPHPPGRGSHSSGVDIGKGREFV